MQDDRFVRIAGIGLVLGSVIGAGVGVSEANNPTSPGTTGFLISQLVVIVVNTLTLVGLIGLARSGAAGDGRLAKVGLGLAVVASALFVPLELYLFVNLDLGGMLLGISSMLQAVGLLLAGIAVLRAGIWSGWHRFTPLLCGLYTFLVLIPALMLAPTGYNGWALAGWQVPFLLMGIALVQNSAGSEYTIAPADA
ncbi:MAG: hypothetical protein ACRC1H_08805 [Caldilineaceae bacterium]